LGLEFRWIRGVVELGSIWESYYESFYKWNEENVKKVPGKSGVYFLYETTKDMKVSLIYIGSSSNLKERFAQYWNTKFSEDQCKQSTKYFKRELTSSIKPREKELLEQYKREHNGKLPRCNEIVP
jgi:excinuclease UvrABC nuclease subunit